MLSHDELDLIYQITEDGIVNCTNGPVFNDFETSGMHAIKESNEQQESTVSEEVNVPSAIEQWTLSDATTFEAEYVMEMSGYATFRNAEGREVKVELEQLSPESRTQIALKNPPKLEFDLVKDQNRVSFSGGNQRGTGSRSPEDRVRYGARIFTRSNIDYDFPMELEVFVIGQERLGPAYILLDKFDVTFQLNRENSRKFEYLNDRLVVLRNYTSRDEPRGEDYRGYVAIVKDIRGEVIATFSSPKFFLDQVDNLRRRSIGSFMDKKCNRIFPTRPKVYF
jgi:hypothetical protein